jgi:hypothetical protein
LARLEGDIRCNHLRQTCHDFSWKNELHDGSTLRAVLASFVDRKNEPSARSNLIDPCQRFTEELRNAVCIDKPVVSHGTSFARGTASEAWLCFVLLCYRFSSFMASTIAIVSTLTRVTRMRRVDHLLLVVRKMPESRGAGKTARRRRPWHRR